MPAPVDRDIHHARALLVEDNALLRGVASHQLRDAGVGEVRAVGKLREARLALERERFDIVVCKMAFDDSRETGQDLLDELRRERLLPHSTVFLMVTEGAAYHQVVEAGEAALDGLLVRPYTAAALRQRLLQARSRKRELGEVLRALDAGEPELALARALKRFQEGAPYGRWCGRLAAELLLDLQRPQDARLLFERLHELKPQPWARLGVARALAAAGDLGGARRELQQLLAQPEPGADAHDLNGRLLLEHGEFEAALVAYRAAAALTPGCLLRAQHAGALAFYVGEAEEAQRWLEQCRRLGVRSRLFDALSIVLLALLRHDCGDSAGVQALEPALQGYCERFPTSQRLRRMLQTLQWLQQLPARAAQACAELQEQTRQWDQPEYDLEAANIWLACWARLPPELREQESFGPALHKLGERFCTSRASTEALCGAAARLPLAVHSLRAAQAEVQGLAERAMALALKEQHEQAAEMLLQAGLRSSNSKLLELTTALVRRQQQPSAVLQQAQAKAMAALQRTARPHTHIAGIERAGRSAPGLRLRPPQVAA